MNGSKNRMCGNYPSAGRSVVVVIVLFYSVFLSDWFAFSEYSFVTNKQQLNKQTLFSAFSECIFFISNYSFSIGHNLSSKSHRSHITVKFNEYKYIVSI